MSCGAPPVVKDAHMFGNMRPEFPVNSIVRYQCNPGFRQRHLPVVRCKADGRWEEPKVECTDGESRNSLVHFVHLLMCFLVMTALILCFLLCLHCSKSQEQNKTQEQQESISEQQKQIRLIQFWKRGKNLFTSTFYKFKCLTGHCLGAKFW